METNERICCICGASVGNGTGRVSKFKGDGQYYCRKHYLQMYRHGEISQFTQKDANEWRDNICVCRGVHGEVTGEVTFELDKREFLRQFKIYINSQGYAVTKTNGKTRLIHKILTETEGYDAKTVVDHINGIRLDNRMENLRVVSQAINVVNKHYGKVVGVSYHSNRRDGKYWRSYIKKDGKSTIEWFNTEEEAIKNRLLREIEVYGKLVSSENKKYEYLINHPSAEGGV